MEEHDDWKLGDEGERSSCARCGKHNPVGLTHCAVCGSRLGDELEADPGSLRTLGEVMGAERRAQRAPRRDSLRVWSIAVAMLFLVVVVLTWLQARKGTGGGEDWAAPPLATPTPMAVATQVVLPTRPPPLPSPVRTVVPPAPPVLTAAPQPARRPVAKTRVVAPARPAPARTITPPLAPPVRVPATEPVEVPPPAGRPGLEATEKPSLGTDLQEATRAYREAVDRHNERVDEYNALVDELQRREARGDDEGSVALQRRLARARAAVESAGAHAETERAHMEAVRARYR